MYPVCTVAICVLMHLKPYGVKSLKKRLFAAIFSLYYIACYSPFSSALYTIQYITD